MKIVLLSGGSGTRLWPLSNDARSKQFLKVLKNEENEFESMVQRVTRQLFKTNPSTDIFITTNKSQVEIIQNQLGNEISLVVEPEKRDTFPAIALMSTYLYSIVGMKLDDVVCVLPVDPYVEDEFFESLIMLEQALETSNADLALMGVKPTYPSEKYGYIVPKKRSENNRFLEVDYFTEKPNEEKAKLLIEKNAYWNCGVFAFKLSTIITKLEKLALPVQYDQMLKQYKLMKKNSFDYEVVEKTENIVFVPYEGTWKDLGTWNTLTDEMDSNMIGKGYVSEDCTNTHLINELDIPVAVLGLSNIVVAASPDGIMVSEKKSSPRVKEAVKMFGQIPMYEEKQWGHFKILDFINDQDEKILTKRVFISHGKNISYQFHHGRRQIWTIVSGEGELFLNGILYPSNKGDVFDIARGSKYAIRAITDLEIIEVHFGFEFSEQETVMLASDWEEIIHHHKVIV